MNRMKRTLGATSAALVGVMALAGVALAADPYGDFNYVQPGNGSTTAVKLVSDANPGYGGINFEVEDGLTFGELNSLSADFQVEADDLCEGGSPRFQVNVIDPNTNTVKNIFVYFGPESASGACTPGTWQSTGDLLEAGKLIDTSQIGGTFYQPYADAVAAFGDYEVVGIQVVVDASWKASDGEQTVLIDNVEINGKTDSLGNVPSNKDECKNGGWQELTDGNDQPFKNQGQCIQYANTGK